MKRIGSLIIVLAAAGIAFFIFSQGVFTWLCYQHPKPACYSHSNFNRTLFKLLCFVYSTRGCAALGQADEGTSQPGSAKWTSFTGDRYRIEFPGSPKVGTLTRPTPIGPVEFETATYAQDAQKRAYFTSTWSHSMPAGTPFDVKAGLDGARDGLLKEVAATLVKETEIELDGRIGRELDIYIPAQNIPRVHNPAVDNAYGVVRIYVDPGRAQLWQAFVLTSRPIDFHEAATFLKSLRLSNDQ